MKTYIVNIPTRKVNDEIQIDKEFLKNVLDFIKPEDPKTEEAEFAKSEFLSANDFQQKVYEIWLDSIAHGPMPWKNKDNIIGEALFVDYTFDPEKIAIHADEIWQLINMVHNATTYEELKFLDNGTQWSKLRQPVSMLMALGNSLKLISFKNDRLKWDKCETQNPEVVFTLKRTK